MGYKLAGYDVIGCNEIDRRVMDLYVKNHNPKYAFLEPIQTFKDREDLPDELYQLDILDGSPPCSTFSMAGCREAAWGVEKKFREGQERQVLDTLFFDFIDLAKRLQPKVVIAENVKGLILGDAKRYVCKIYERLEEAGYYCQHWLLDAQNMGVPQRRERVFFIALRKDLAEPFLYQANIFEQKPRLVLEFHERRITVADAGIELGDPMTRKSATEEWRRLVSGQPKKYLQSELYSKSDVHPTLTASYREKASPMPYWEMQWLSKIQ